MIPIQRARRVVYNSGLLTFAKGFQALLSVILVGFVARYLGQVGFGTYGFVVSLGQLFVVAGQMGLPRIVVREVSRDKEQTATYLGNAVSLLLITMGICCLAAVVATSFVAPETEVVIAMITYLLSEVIMALAMLGYSVFRAHERMEYQTIITVIGQTFNVVLALLFIYLDLGLVALFLAMCMANLCRLFMTQYLLRRGFAKPVFHWNSSLTKYLFLSALPVGASFLLRSWLWKGGIVLLTAMHGEAEVGLMFGPLRVVEQLRILPYAFVSSLLPLLSQQSVVRWRAFLFTLQESLKVALIGGLLIALVLVSFSDQIVLILFGPEFPESAEALQILGWATLLTFPNILLGGTLVALDRQEMETVSLLIGLVISLSASVLFIPTYGFKAVSYAVLLGEAAFFALSLAFVWRRTSAASLPVAVAKIAASGALAGMVLRGGRAYTPPVVLALALLVLVGSLFLLRTFDEREMRFLKGLLSGSSQDVEAGGMRGESME